MRKIVIAVETGSDISEELKKEYGIYTVPMHVSFGNVTKDDGTFPPAEVCGYYEKTGELPKTSAAMPPDYERVFKEIKAANPFADILLLGYSAVTTTSFENALKVSSRDPHIACVDTKNVSLGQCAVAVKVAKLIQKHPEWSLKQAAEAAKCVSEQTKMLFVPDKLEYLKAGGRVKTGTAFLGTLLGIHPIIEIKDGYLCLAKKTRGSMRHCIKKLFAYYIENFFPEPDEIWLGGTTGLSPELKELACSAANELGFEDIHWIDAGSVITTHGGPNAFGIAAYCRKK